MSFVPNLPRAELTAKRGVPEDFVAWPFVDELYDYTQLLGPGKTLGSLPQARWGDEVAIVGAGAAGMVAAYELLKLGLKPIVFEATGRIGGRAWTEYFSDSGGSNGVFAEMGAMRVPTQNKVFYYYADLLGLEYSEFPDPGKVPTILYYENQVYDWQPNQLPPGPFASIADDFNAFVGPLMNKIYGPWQQGNLSAVRQIWQAYVDRYKNMSFFEGLADGIPKWTTEDFNAFGALGMGSGGFGPLYGVGFLELLRILVNQFETDQQLVQYGIAGLTEGLYASTVEWPNGQEVSLQSLDCVQLDTAVTAIQYDETSGNPVVSWTNMADTANPQSGSQKYPAVIIATTTRSMEMIGLTSALPQDNVNTIISSEEKVAVRNLHLMESSKLFIRTATKFWLDGDGQTQSDLPQNIQTDELPRGVYCLDYPQTDQGVVLISYTWGDDSAKLLALPPAERFRKLKDVIAVIHPKFASYLEPVGGDDQIYNVDWEAMPYYYGAFKLQGPGEDAYVQSVFNQFQVAMDKTNDRGVYLAGDSVSWAGGWTEGALHTGLNAASAAALRLGAKLPSNSPMTIDPNLYDYWDAG
jgi:tryptophan 2-monooxygenase